MWIMIMNGLALYFDRISLFLKWSKSLFTAVCGRDLLLFFCSFQKSCLIKCFSRFLECSRVLPDLCSYSASGAPCRSPSWRADEPWRPSSSTWVELYILKTWRCLERRKLLTGCFGCARLWRRSFCGIQFDWNPEPSFSFVGASRLREASVAVKFVTNTTKESKRNLLERLQRLNFNIQVELIKKYQRQAMRGELLLCTSVFPQCTSALWKKEPHHVIHPPKTEVFGGLATPVHVQQWCHGTDGGCIFTSCISVDVHEFRAHSIFRTL